MIKALLAITVTLVAAVVALEVRKPNLKLVPEAGKISIEGINQKTASLQKTSTTTDRKPKQPEELTNTKVAHNPAFHGKVKPFLDKYCVACHGPKKQKSDLRVDTLSTVLDNTETAEEWQHILDELNGATMPPEDEPQPSAKELTDVLETLTFQIDEAKKKLYGQNTEVVMRRLNRREYINTVHELTGVRLNEVDVPQDSKSASFDTDGKGLFMSAYQFESYLEVGQQVMDQAIFANKKPTIYKTSLTPSTKQILAANKAIKKVSETLKSPKNKNQRRNAEADLEAYKLYNSIKAHKKAAIISPYIRFFKELGVKTMPKSKFSPGLYRFEITCGHGNLNKGDKAFINLDFDYTKKATKDLVKYYEVKGSTSRPHKITIEVELDQHRAFVIDSMINRQGDNMAYVAISKIEFSGPHFKQWPPASHQKIFPIAQGNMSDTAYSTKILSLFSEKAFMHKKPTVKFRETLQQIYKSNRASGMSLHNAIKEPLAIIISSPKFLYLLETDAKEDDTIIPDFELANRLSYFLWSSKPDATLLKMASAGKLHQPQILKAQITRMLADKKSYAFSAGFVPQWLHLDKFNEVDVGKKLFPKYNLTIGKNMQLESIHFFDTIMRKNLSILNFIDSKFITVNNILRSYYDLPTTSEDGFSIYKLPENSPRGGLLGQGTVQIMTGNGRRTSPVLRGAFILETMIGTPSPEPPPNVPQLESEQTDTMTIREVLKIHQEQPQCSSCHRRIDPLGFGMENFDAAGVWRDSVAKGSRKKKKKMLPIDNHGALPNGSKYKGVFELKQQLMKYKDGFSKAFIENLLGYALGRRIGFADAQLVDHLLQRSKVNNYKMADIVKDIILSKQFRTK